MKQKQQQDKVREAVKLLKEVRDFYQSEMYKIEDDQSKEFDEVSNYFASAQVAIDDLNETFKLL